MPIAIAVILIIALFIFLLLEGIGQSESAQGIFGAISGVLFILIIVTNYYVATSPETRFSLLDFIVVLPAVVILAELLARIIVRARTTSFIVSASRSQSGTKMLVITPMFLLVWLSFLIPLRRTLDGSPAIDASYFVPTRIFALVSLVLWVINDIILFVDRIKICESGILQAGKLVPWSAYESFSLRDKDESAVEIELTYRTKSRIRMFRSMRVIMPIDRRHQMQQLLEQHLAVGTS